MRFSLDLFDKFVAERLEDFISYWGKNHLNIAGVLLCGFGIASSFSISITQFFLGVSLAIWLFDVSLYLLYMGSARNAHLIQKHFEGYKIYTIFYALLAWVLLRFTHLAFTSNFSEELHQLREIWLLAIVPLVMFRLPSRRWCNAFIICILIGCATTGAYNLYQHIAMGFTFGDYRVGGFTDTTHSLTYTGITGIILFLGLGASFGFWLEKNKRIAIYAFLMSLLTFAGFAFSQSRGGFIALIPTFLIFMGLGLRKKFFFALPLILILGGFIYKYTPGIDTKFYEAKDKLVENIKQNKNCGTLIDRITYLQTGVSIWRQNVILGVGNGDYAAAYQKHRPPDVCGIAAGRDPHLHNDILNTLVLFGALGLGIFLCFYILPLVNFLRIFYQDEKQRHLWFSIGALAGVIMEFFMGLSQSHFTDEEVQMVFWIAIGLFYRYSKDELALLNDTYPAG